MKLNRKTLRRLIKEELARSVEAQRLEEAGGFGADTHKGVLSDKQLMDLQMILDGGPMGPNYMDIARQVNAGNLAAMVDSLGAWQGRGAEVEAQVLGPGMGKSIGEAAGSAEAIARLKRTKELEAQGMGHAQAKRVPGAEDADETVAALWAWIQKNAPDAAANAMSALRGGGSAGTWHDDLNPGSPESKAGVFPEGVSSLSDLLESFGLERAHQIEAKLVELGMDSKSAYSVTNDLLNAAAGYTHAANTSGKLSDEQKESVSAAGDVSDDILQQLAGGGPGGSDSGGDDWESAWTKYSGSSAGTQRSMHASEDS